jgi:hypothetical protein
MGERYAFATQSAIGNCLGPKIAKSSPRIPQISRNALALFDSVAEILVRVARTGWNSVRSLLPGRFDESGYCSSRRLSRALVGPMLAIEAAIA